MMTYCNLNLTCSGFFNDWVEMPLPSDATRRVGMRDPVRVMNQLAPTRAEIGQVVQALTALREAVRTEGLDRPIARPETRKPSVEDLELVAWELVVGPDGLLGSQKPAGDPVGKLLAGG